jgi:hypothetical protein
VGPPLPAVRTRGNGGVVGRRGGRVLGDGLIGASAIAATIGASAGYYAAAYVSALRLSYRDHDDRRWPSRVLISNLLALRSVAVEFGPAELIDSVAVRPVAFYLGPLIFDNTIGGWIFGKLVSDLAFYLIAIVSYERFKALLVRAEPSAEEVTDGSVSTVEAA